MALRIIAWPMATSSSPRESEGCWSLPKGRPPSSPGIGFALIATSAWRGEMVLRALHLHGLFVYVIVRRLSGFRWSAAARRTGLFYVGLIGVVFTSFLVLPESVATWLGSGALVIASAYSWRMVRGLVGDEAIPRKLKWLRG